MFFKSFANLLKVFGTNYISQNNAQPGINSLEEYMFLFTTEFKKEIIGSYNFSFTCIAFIYKRSLIHKK